MSSKQEKNKDSDISSKDQSNNSSDEQVLDEEPNAEDETTDVDQLLEDQQKRINDLEQEIQQVRENQLRKVADMENFKKRLQRERDQIFQSSRETSVEAFLPVYDDLLRTLKAMEEGGADPSYIDGIKLVANKFEDVLERYNVERIDQTGVPFDVDLHDALMRQKPEDESIDSGIVLQVFENGYKMGDKTLRHAKVIVSE